MKRIALTIALSLFSLSALAVDITITLDAQGMNALQTVVGENMALTTPETPAVVTNGVVTTPAIPGVPRDATAQEARRYVRDLVQGMINDRRSAKAKRAAEAAAVVPAPVTVTVN